MSEDLSRMYRFAVDTSQDFITLVNRSYVYEIANPAYCQILGKSQSEIVGRNMEEIWGKKAFRTVIKRYLDECFSGRTVHFDEKFRVGQTTKHLHVSYYPYKSGTTVSHVLVFSRDRTDQKVIEEKLMNYEFRDHVTGLFNRRSLEILLDKEIEKSKRSRTEKLRALLFISLERLAQVNQTHGHHIGDILLENTGLRIKSTLRKSDYIFRFEGKELTVLLGSITRNTDVAKVAQKIINAVSIPYRFKGTDIQISCVVGITVYPEDGEEKNTLIRNAATAMNEAKRRGKEFLVFNAELHERSVAKLKLESEMFSAFGGNQYRLHYQPVVDPSGRIVGCEALIRWQHPEMGLMSPGRFIPLAEETGLIMSIGKWALYRACKQARRWSTEYGLYVSVNLSAHEFENPNLPQVVSGVLKSAEDLDPRYLKLEITETESMGDPEFAIGQMRALLDMGVELCIDDFGRGRSSLTYLKTLPATTLKIDRAFVEGIVEDAAEREYLDSIIRMVRSRKKTVLVEGVSRQAQVELLKPMRCDLMQGFYFSKPLPAEELEPLLERTKVFPV